MVIQTPRRSVSILNSCPFLLVSPERCWECGLSRTNGDLIIPILYSERADGKLQWEHDGPLEHVVPSHGESPRRVDEAGRVGIETARDGIHHSELTEGVDGAEHHDANDQEVDEEGGRTALGERTARADEEAGANGATNGDHVQVAGPHAALELDDAGAIVALLEGLQAGDHCGSSEVLVPREGSGMVDEPIVAVILGKSITALLVAERGRRAHLAHLLIRHDRRAVAGVDWKAERESGRWSLCLLDARREVKGGQRNKRHETKRDGKAGEAARYIFIIRGISGPLGTKGGSGAGAQSHRRAMRRTKQLGRLVAGD